MSVCVVKKEIRYVSLDTVTNKILKRYEYFLFILTYDFLLFVIIF
jgi:hypothetical protein